MVDLKRQKKNSKAILAVLAVVIVLLILCVVFARKTSPLISGTDDSDPGAGVTESSEMPGGDDGQEPLTVSVNIAKYYARHTGDPGNLYHIDANHVLWGSGNNTCGQLGQGTQDDEFYSENIKIAENVIHVDDSQRGFVIFLTEEHELYGVGAYIGTSPVLLMEDVAYACCGRDDIVCLKEDATVWTWRGGCAGGSTAPMYSYDNPEKLLDDAVLVTGGWFNHAALLRDGTVWTWGDNSAGSCGVAKPAVVSDPTRIAENVVMVWTDFAVDGHPQPGAEERAMAWTGKLKYDTEHESIAELDEVYPGFLNNTVIQKADGSYWVCGENVGTEEKVIPGEEGDYSAVYSHEFYPCE